MPRFKLDDFLTAVHNFFITDVAVVPSIISALLGLPMTRSYLLQSLQYVLCAGAPLSAEAQAKLCSLLSPSAVVSQCWGMTEAGWLSTFDPSEKDTTGSVGRLLMDVELKLINDTGCIVTGEGMQGEAYVRSPAMFQGYVGDFSSTPFDLEGFYRTGDIVHVQDGKIYILGRKKEIVKVKGWQVSPAQLEGILMGHPKVADAAVTGLLHIDSHGIEETRLRAFVVPQPYLLGGESLLSLALKRDIQAYLESRVVAYKRLTGGVVFVDKIPRTATGKIQRAVFSDLPPNSNDTLF